MNIKKIQHTYQNFELSIHNICLPSSGIVGLVGKNGAGKTTLMKCLSNPDFCNGICEIEDFQYSEVLFIPSDLNAYEFLTVREFVALLIKYNVSDLLELDVIRLLKLEDKADVLISQLSQGMQKKLTLAPLFIRKNKLIILDEPFNSIDLEYTYLLKQALTDIAKTSTILISSHIIDSLQGICESIYYMEDGKIKRIAEGVVGLSELEAQVLSGHA